MHCTKRTSGVWIIAALLLLLISPLFAGGQAEGEAETSPQLSLAVLSDLDSMPLVIAEMKGFYEEEGVTVELQHFKSPVDRDTAFQAGEADGAISDLLAVGFALNGGFPVRVTSLTNGSYKLILSPGSELESIEELKGKTVGLSKNTIIEYCTDRMTQAAGFSSELLEKAVIPQIPVRLEMLTSGKIDAATLPEPLASMAVAKGGVMLNSSDKLGVNPGIIMFSSTAIEEKREAVAAFYRAYNRGVEYMTSHEQDEYMPELVETMGLPDTLAAGMELPEYQPATLPAQQEVEEVMSWMKERDLIDRPFSYDELVEQDLLP